MDSELLLSCAKDNRTLCWNVKTGEIQSEVEVNAQTWNFDVQWSPRIPAILSTSSLERKARSIRLFLIFIDQHLFITRR
jgi:protein transport protein SEC31